MKYQSEEFRENFLNDWDHISSHGIDSCHNYFGMSEEIYVLHKNNIKALLSSLKKQYLILNINNEERHTYDNVYMDTKKYDIGKKQGSKKYDFSVRTRSYNRNDDLYFQIKHISNERSNVYSYVYTDKHDHMLTKEMRNRYCGIYEGILGVEPKKLIFPSIQISYDRYILYNKKLDERVDIDINIRFTNLRDLRKPSVLLKDIVMIESKSSSKETKIHRLLDRIKTKKTAASLYSIGLHYLGEKINDTKLKKTIEKIEKIQKNK